MKLPQTTKIVIFDADGTLFTLSQPIGEVYREHFSAYGIECSSEQTQRAFRAAWNERKELYLNSAGNHTTSEAQEIEGWRSLVSLTLSKLGVNKTPFGLFEDVFEYYRSGQSRMLTRGISELLQRLQSHSIQTGVLSNLDARLHDVLKSLGLTPLFNHVFISSELGVKKPALECFERVENATGFQGQELLMIGDVPALDYFPALKAGWNAVLYNPKQREFDGVKHWVECFDVFTI